MPDKIKTLADLKPDAKNARKHNPRNIGMVADSIREVGAARSGVIDEKGNILAGNGTYEALAEAGITNIRVVKASGNEWVVVQRDGLSEEQKRRLALYDNRTAELADWEGEVLKEFNDDDPDFLAKLFYDDELESILDIEPEEPPKEKESGAGAGGKEVECPKCEHKFIPE
jgi:ParB-like chromosome segregation protein Spo0J